MPTARVLDNRSVAKDLHHLTLDVRGSDLEAGHTAPGQFVTIGIGGLRPGFFAIASAPGATPGSMEFLIKRQGPTATALCDAAPGSEVTLSAVMGEGFPLASVEGRDLVLFATGSGISAIRPVIEAGLGDRRVVLYYGALTREWMAWTERFEGWRAAGVDVRSVLSHEPEDSDYVGPRGFVQHLFVAAPPPFELSEAGFVLCGLPAMVDEVKGLLAERGVPPERILLNF